MARGTVEQSIQVGKTQHRLSLTRHSMVTAVNLSEMSFACVYTKSQAATKESAACSSTLWAIRRASAVADTEKSLARQDLPFGGAATITVAPVSQHQNTWTRSIACMPFTCLSMTLSQKAVRLQLSAYSYIMLSSLTGAEALQL